MAEISGATIDWTDYSADPSIARTIHIPTSLTEATVQDLTDTLSAEQAELDALIYANLLDGPGTGGKQALGAGVYVGLTTTANHLKVSFDARKDAAQEGTVTTGDANGVTLNDSAATFLTNGVTPGAQATNLTDGSRCTVLRVLSEQQLVTDGLGDGVDDRWDLGDAYEIQVVTQVEISGGNLVAIDEGGDPAEVVLPTAGTQVVRTSSSSATLQELQDLQVASFDQGSGKGVLVDPNDDTGLAGSGTAYPTGTARRPVDNWADALAIAAERGFGILYVLGQSLTLDNSLDYTGLLFIGHSIARTSLTVPSGAVVVGTEYQQMTLEGTFSGTVFMDRCDVVDVTMTAGQLHRCGLCGTVTMAGGPSITMVNCYDAVAGLGTPVLDMGGSGVAAGIRGYRGGLKLQNKTGSEDVSIDGMARLVLASDYGGSGTLVVRGVAEPVEVLGSFTNITDAGLVSPDGIWDEGLNGSSTLDARTALRRIAVALGYDPSNPVTATKVTDTLRTLVAGPGGSEIVDLTLTGDPADEVVTQHA